MPLIPGSMSDRSLAIKYKSEDESTLCDVPFHLSLKEMSANEDEVRLMESRK